MQTFASIVKQKKLGGQEMEERGIGQEELKPRKEQNPTTKHIHCQIITNH